MSVTIPQTTAVGLGPELGATPLVRSRSVSLRLGPFGITYATDQVVWSDALGASARQAQVEQAQAELAHTEQIQTEQAQAEQSAASTQASPQSNPAVLQASRHFARDLEAARRQAEFQRQAETTAPARDAEAKSELGGSAQDEMRQKDDTRQNAAREQATGSRMRQAIGAYLACAAGFGQCRSMLHAVA